MFDNVAEKIRAVKIVPVVTVFDPSVAVKIADSLVEGGVKAVEFTFRNINGSYDIKKAGECIRAVEKSCPEMLVGAGTVINPELAKIALDSGAQFVMSPGFNPATVEFCIQNKLPVFPGVNNPSNIEEALMYGLSVLKFFPAEVSGGVKMLKALSGPFPGVKFIPTGGINEQNAEEYLNCRNVIAVGGSWICEQELIKTESWKEITRRAADFS